MSCFMSFLLYHQSWTLTLQKITIRKKVCLPFEHTVIWHKFTLGSLTLQASLELAKDFKLVRKICPLTKVILCVSTWRKTIRDNVFETISQDIVISFVSKLILLKIKSKYALRKEACQIVSPEKQKHKNVI